MALKCFKCLREIDGGVQTLFWHLKFVHSVFGKTQTEIVCCEPGCSSVIYRLDNYKKHIIQKHIPPDSSSDEDEASLPTQNNQNVPEHPPSHTTQQRQMQNEAEETEINKAFEDFDDDDGGEIGLLFSYQLALFIAKLKATSTPYATIQTIVKHVKELIADILECLKKRVINSVQRGQMDYAAVNDIFDQLNIPFEEFSTDSKFVNFVKERNILVEPQQKTLGSFYKTVTDRKTGRSVQVEHFDSFQYLPIKKTLKQFLERPGTMHAILEKLTTEKDESLLESYMDGEYFKRKFGNSAEVIIPLLLYSDDFETANPLGSHKGEYKVCGFYISVLALPTEFQGNMENVLLAALTESSHIREYGMDSVLSFISDELNEITQNGIQIDTEDFTGIVKPVLFQVIGDNLSLNTMMGFSGSFSANYYCRECKVLKAVAQKQVTEDQTLLRDGGNFDDDLATGDVSKTGIIRSSALNTITGYHVVDNYVFDIMHDFLEGVLPLEIKLIIRELLSEGYFSLNELNIRIASFNYGPADVKNKPSYISQNQLNNPGGASGQKAIQMMTLAVYLPLIMGDLVDEDSEHWKLLLIILEIFQLVVASSVSANTTYYLAAIIAEHHTVFLRLFPEINLTPKQHFLVHYPRSIRNLGPLIQYWAMGMERKHKPFKA